MMLAACLLSLGLVTVAGATLPVAPANASSDPGTYVPLSYARLFDTQASGQAGAYAAGETRTYNVLGVGGVPTSGVSAVVVDVAATSSTVTSGSSYIKVWEAGTARPDPSVVIVNAQTAPLSNTIVVSPNAAGQISVYASAGATDLNLDIQGYFTTGSGGGFDATRATVVDSDNSIGIAGDLPSTSTYNLQVTGSKIPAGATSVFINVVTKRATADGSLTFYPRGGTPTGAKSVNYSNGGDDATGLFVPLDATGGFAVRNLANSGTIALQIEVQGYFVPQQGSQEGVFRALPQPVLGDQTVPANSSIDVTVGGTNGMPVYGIGSVALTLVARQYTATGTLKIGPAPSEMPTYAHLKFDANETSSDGVAATTLVPTGKDGKVRVFNTSSAPVYVRLAVQGWFSGHRAISAAEEANFISAATDAGAPSWLAQLAVWDDDLAAGLPTQITPLAEDPDGFATVWDGISGTSGDPDATSAPAAPTGAYTATYDVPDATAPSSTTTYRTAANGTCASGWSLHETSMYFDFKNFAGYRAWTIQFTKRWCGNRTTKQVGTVWSQVVPRVRGAYAMFWSDAGPSGAKAGYLKWDGVHNRSAHFTQRGRAMKFCGIKNFEPLCLMYYVDMEIISIYGGGYRQWEKGTWG
jgi:hypothetical protein